MSALSDIQDNMKTEWRKLESQWHSTRAQWHDSVGDRFEKEFWNEMEETVPQFLRELEQVDEVLNRALRILDQ